ncbi:MAG: 2-amino-4-hydroxy-6-hydroxymethyldihydropteridine diphosphokinase [Cyanobacteriota bacterium]|nr:2-amino-4-hydroxy-6-hydroxymethyldihydropteridine diphosphokinase [Cyanobacteriota bacterium]
MRASLADQGQGPLEQPDRAALACAIEAALRRPNTLAIALGANLPSPVGEPAATLEAAEPGLITLLQDWLKTWLAISGVSGVGRDGLLDGRCHWSPQLSTAPVGGPPGQCDYTNAALVVELPEGLLPAAAPALDLLRQLQGLEAHFGRPPLTAREHWGPRSLDLDLLWWGDLQLDLPATASTPALRLPHPLWRQRSFVLDPLAALVREIAS